MVMQMCLNVMFMRTLPLLCNIKVLPAEQETVNNKSKMHDINEKLKILTF
jgi:hypothetical protein